MATSSRSRERRIAAGERRSAGGAPVRRPRLGADPVARARAANPAWILAADRAAARLYEAAGAEPLVPLEVLTNPDAHASEAQLHRHTRGRQASSATGRQSALGSRRSGRKFTLEAFAKRVCRRLEAAREAGQLGRLYVVAAPEMLGMIREGLTRGVARRVAGSVSRDPARLDSAQIRHALPERI